MLPTIYAHQDVDWVMLIGPRAESPCRLRANRHATKGDQNNEEKTSKQGARKQPNKYNPSHKHTKQPAPKVDWVDILATLFASKSDFFDF